MSGGVQRDAGLQAAIAHVGIKPMARACGVSPAAIRQNWTRIPQKHLFTVASLCRLEAEDLRPDLADWCEQEAVKHAMARARARFGSDGSVTRLVGANEAAEETGVGPRDPIMGVWDLVVLAHAMRFAAGEAEEELNPRDLWSAPPGAGGWPSAAQQARAYAMALAVVVGRVEPTSIAQRIGTTKQNVQNAARRYQDRRDGEDGEGGDHALWAAEARFLEGIAR